MVFVVLCQAEAINILWDRVREPSTVMDKEFWSRFKDLKAGPRSTGALLSSDNLAGEVGPEKMPFYAHKLNVPADVFDNINGVVNGYRPVQQTTRQKTLDILESLDYLNANGVNIKEPNFKKRVEDGIQMSPLSLKLEGGGRNPFKEFMTQWNDISRVGIGSTTPAVDQKRNLVTKFFGDPVISPNNLALTATDRVIFIAMTFVLRAVSMYIVEWSVNTYMVKSFQNAFKLYLVCYLSLFTLWVVMVNASKMLFFKMLFYYVSTDPHGIVRILVHVFVQLMILPVPLIVKTKGFEYTEEEYTYEQRRKTMSVLNNFTFFIWAITSIIATQY